MERQNLSSLPCEDEVARISTTLDDLSEKEFDLRYLKVCLALSQTDDESPEGKIVWATIFAYQEHPLFDLNRIKKLRVKK